MTGDDPEKLRAKLEASPAYRLAREDLDFLREPDQRPLRLQLELLKPESYLRAADVISTIVVYGSARVRPPDASDREVADAEDRCRACPEDAAAARDLDLTRRRRTHARWYLEAQRFGRLVSERFQRRDGNHFVIMTGGGPGIMEAANRGAHDVGCRSIGLNIMLPHEQQPNAYISPELCFQFQYFGLRKMHFMLRARALVAFPGGFGTLDEILDALTLVQTGKMPRIPILLVDTTFWHRVLDLGFLVDEGLISASDAELVTYVDSADEALAVLESFYGRLPPGGTHHV